MLTSTSSMTQTISPTPSISSKSMVRDVNAVDISDSRKLLRSTNEFGSVVLTPRKRALARKNNNNNSDLIASTPSSTGMVSPPMTSQKSIENLRSPQSRTSGTLDDPVHINQVEDYDPEERSTLFESPKANIYSFEELAENMEEKQGRLLGHGKFEIFQMHMKNVSYLQCGSVVYPIFPRLKILKISKNQFILPLSNPERYWRIVIETNEQSVIKALELVFKNICHFRNVYIASERDHEPEPESKKLQTEINPPRDILTSSKSQVSLSSITTAVACFALESDSSTFVEQISPELTPLPNNQPSRNDEDETKSVASSLDSALEEFNELPKSILPSQLEESDQYLENSRYYTPTSSRHNTTIMDESRDTIIFLPTGKYESTRIQNTAACTRSSRSASLYVSESSWMDPTDDHNNVQTSTPGTERYIRLNLNPNPRFIENGKENKEKRIVTDSILANKNHRYSSYDIYNISCDDDSKKQDPGITGFLKSFFQ